VNDYVDIEVYEATLTVTVPTTIGDEAAAVAVMLDLLREYAADATVDYFHDEGDWHIERATCAVPPDQVDEMLEPAVALVCEWVEIGGCFDD
jgi:hypothetical protein